MSKKAIDLKNLAKGAIASTAESVSATGAELLWTDRMAIGQKEGMKASSAKQE